MEIRNEKGQFVEGHPGGPGRPKGSISIKDLVRKHLEDNPEDLREFVRHFIKKNRELAWQMIEGRPHQSSDMELGITPKPLLDAVFNNNSDKKDSEAPKED